MSDAKYKTIIFLSGFLFRLFLVVSIIFINPYGLHFFANPDFQGSDQADFALVTKNIADHGVFSFSKAPPFTPDEFRTPLFPLFTSLFYWLTGNFLLYSFLNIILSALIGVIVYEICLLLFTGKKLAFLAGLIFGFLPYTAYLSTMVMADTLFTFLFLIAMFFAFRFLKDQSRSRDLIWTGVFLGLATLTRPISQYFIFAVIFSLLLLPTTNARLNDTRKEKACLPAGRKLIWSLVVICAFTLVISPWLIRNYIVFKEVKLSSLGGHHMFVSWITPYRAYVKDHIPRSEEAVKTAEYIKEKYGKYGSEAMYDPVISAGLGEESKREILGNLGTYLPFHAVSSAIYYMNNDVVLTLSEVFQIRPGKGVYIVEKIFNRDWRGFLNNVSELGFVYVIVYFLSYFLIFAKNLLALYGLKKYLRISPVLTLFVLMILIYFPILVGPEGHARFRMPVEPFLLIFALAGVSALINFLKYKYIGTKCFKFSQLDRQ
ncbi:MAG: glycosyltransferase family 39 protein [bacterium]|nr:glycosyltransferase family 39 protein [bacterium]